MTEPHSDEEGPPPDLPDNGRSGLAAHDLSDRTRTQLVAFDRQRAARVEQIMGEVAQREQQLTAVRQQMVEQAASVVAIEHQLVDEAVVTARLRRERDEHAAEATNLRVELAEAHREHAAEATSLRVELAEAHREHAAEAANLRVELAEAHRAVHEITSSTGYAVLKVLWRMRTRLVPPGSLRDRVLWILLCLWRAYRTGGMDGAMRLFGQVVRDTLKRLARVSAQRLLRASGVVAVPGVPVAVAGVTVAAPSTVGGAAVPVEAPDAGPLTLAVDAPSLTIAAQARAQRPDVIILPIINWGFRYQRPQQLAARLAEAGHRVLYVETTFHAGSGAILKPLVPGIVEVQLPGPPEYSIYTNQLSTELCGQLVLALAELRKTLGLTDVVCMVDLPFWTPLAFELRDRFGWRIVYDCLDDYAGFDNTGPAMLASEERLARGSDLVLATSRHLLAKQSALNPNTILLPNAADFEHFRFLPSQPAPELAQLRGPVIGYYGAISDWFDTRLVSELARARPDWSFVLVGSTFGADLRPLNGLANVLLLGEKPYTELPAYLKVFDVCTIPFRATPLTNATNPVKLFEYLSAGKPVVATRLSELAYYHEYVTLAAGPSEWLAALDAALAPAATQPVEIERRIAFARTNGWDERARVLRAAIDRLYGLASIIIVTYNNADYTRLCLDSIYRKTIYPNYEVIVVDNCSTDGTQALLAGYASAHDNFQCIQNERNEGFAKANNIGLANARGEYVVLLNNDTIVSPEWLSTLIFHLRDPQVGMVGPLTNWSGNESRIDVTYTSVRVMDEFARAYTRARYDQLFDIRMLAMFCVALRRATFDEIGPLDERFGIGMFEDDDYALRVRQRGLRVVCAEDAFIHHWGAASFSKLPRETYDTLFDENRRQFEDKWGASWQPHQYRSTASAG